MVRCLTLVSEHDFIIPPCDPNEGEAYVVPDVTDIARQSHELVTLHSLFTLFLPDVRAGPGRGTVAPLYCCLSGYYSSGEVLTATAGHATSSAVSAQQMYLLQFLNFVYVTYHMTV
jgi:hypothetical protein